MFKSIVVVFLAGWIGWFWMDKGPSDQSTSLGGKDVLTDFQFAFDLLKLGEARAAYAFIWPHHFLALSLIGGVLLWMTLTSIKRLFARRRWRARMTFPKTGRIERRNDD